MNGAASGRGRRSSQGRRRPDISLLLRMVVYLCAGITLLALLLLIAYILVKGVPHLTVSLFALEYTSENVSLLPALINTLMMTGLALLLSIPPGVGASIYLTEYADRNSKKVALIRLTAETLSGIPSIIYGLFGMLFFVTYWQWGYSLLAGAATLAIMVLPLIMRSTEEALKATPDSYREASFGLGAGKFRTVSRIVLPSAIPGILAGIILAIGRIVGETAALIYTAGSVAVICRDLLSSGRTLSLHMYLLSSEGLYTDQAYATAVVLLGLVLLLNLLSGRVAGKLTKGNE
ncbi:MAG: phosphate ABC transporter permease PstA [Syntrophomonadaceae bacterium]|nr:phosphate ABC transporter permease PstA [Syntrophomonadaceae bacterium]